MYVRNLSIGFCTGIAVVLAVLVRAMGADEKPKKNEEAKGTKVWRFEDDKPGAIAQGFTREVGEWKVVSDDTAPSKGQALAQEAKNSGGTFNLAFVSDVSQKDVDLSVKMKAIAGEEDQGGGLVWRARDAKNYYVARFNPLEDNYRVYKVVDGKRIQLGNADVKNMPGWHKLRVVMKGDQIECYLDDKKLMDVKDTTLTEAGKIGLWSKADAQSHFDDLTLGEPR